MPSAADKPISLRLSHLAGTDASEVHALGIDPLDIEASGIEEGALVAIHGVATASLHMGPLSTGCGSRLHPLFCLVDGGMTGRETDQVK